MFVGMVKSKRFAQMNYTVLKSITLSRDIPTVSPENVPHFYDIFCSLYLTVVMCWDSS